MAKTLWVSYRSHAGTPEGPGSSGVPIEYPHWVSFDAGSDGGYAPSQIC